MGVFDTLSTANQYRDTYLGSFPQDFAFTNIFRRLWLKTEIKTLQTLLFELIKAFLVRAKV